MSDSLKVLAEGGLVGLCNAYQQSYPQLVWIKSRTLSVGDKTTVCCNVALLLQNITMKMSGFNGGHILLSYQVHGLHAEENI